VGTGTGRMLELFGPRVEYAVGVDSSREMLAYARATIEEQGLSNSQVRLGDMYTLPIVSQSQDFVVIHQVLHYADRPMAVINEGRRVLKEGGALVIIDFAPHNVLSLKEEHAHQQMGFDNHQIREWCSQTGFRNVESHVLPGDPLTVNIWVARA
jgi:ubiquinone/menaquinone biosynthesis C-methylase UbiE